MLRFARLAGGSVSSACCSVRPPLSLCALTHTQQVCTAFSPSAAGASAAQPPTIYALSTAPGEARSWLISPTLASPAASCCATCAADAPPAAGRSAVCVVRASGASARDVIRLLPRRTALPEPRVATLAMIADPVSGVCGCSTRSRLLCPSIELLSAAPSALLCSKQLQMSRHVFSRIIHIFTHFYKMSSRPTRLYIRIY